MMWRENTLGELCAASGGDIQTGPFGSQLHAADYVQVGVPVVMPTNIGDNAIDSSGIACVTSADAERLDRYRLRADDIVYPRRGDIEKRALVRKVNDGWLCGTGCLRVRLGDAAICDPVFLSYLLGTDEVKDWVMRHAVGATMPNLNTTILGSLPLRLPQLGDQRAIADVLAALDDKIAASLEIASRCDELRSAIVRRSSLPGSDVVTVTLSAVTTLLSRGVAPSYVEDGSGVRVLNQKCVRNHVVDAALGRTTAPAKLSAAKMLVRNDVLVNSTGAGTLGRAARWTTAAEATVDSHITIVRFDAGVVDPVTAGVALLALEPALEAMAEGSTGQTELPRAKLGALELRLPGRATQELLGREISALDDVENAHRREASTSSTMRDTLLPELMSGRLRVKDAEKQVEAVV